MQMIQILAPASLALTLGAAAATAALAPPAAKPAVVRLQPLSEKDLMSTREMGCTCTFDTKSGTLVQAIGKELMVRTQAGRKVCPISDAQFQRMAGATGTYSCGSVRMSLRRTGRISTEQASDSASSPASLTLGEGPARRSVSGTWGCAC